MKYLFPVFLAIWGGVLAFAFPNSLELLSQNWFITFLAFIAALFANATAVGGGFIFVPLFILGYGLTPLAALKLSLATQAFGMTSGSLGWSRDFIVMKALLVAIPASFIGMYLATFEVSLHEINIKKVFGWVSIFIFFVVVLEIRYGRQSHNEEMVNDTFAKSAIFAVWCLLGGMLTAWTSIGIGEVVVIYLLFVYRIRIEKAIGTGVAAMALDSILGFAFHVNLGGIPWEMLIFTVPGVILGGYYGARMGKLIEERMRVRRSEKSYTILTDHSHSPLKYLFAGIILLDAIVMLL